MKETGVAEELEDLVRRGLFDEVEKRLRKMSPSKVPRQDAFAIANIARRIHRPQLAMRILQPIVRSDNASLMDPPTGQEQIEYAEAVRRLGAVQEAWQILQGVDVSKFPQALIHQSFCLFNQWKYREAIPLLRQYVQVADLSAYSQCMGKVNLVAALIHEKQIEEAAAVLQELRTETERSEFFLFYGNCLELSAQISILEQNWDQAFEYLNQSSVVLQRTAGSDELWVRKWKAIADSLRQRRVTEELREVFQSAKKNHQWETYRDCDLYIAEIEMDLPRISHLFFGTPYAVYRERIQQSLGPNWVAPQFYVWSLSSRPTVILDVTTGQVEGGKASRLPIGQVLHRFLILLARDFYRPLPMLTAFGGLFPNEFMNPYTSLNRVHQVVRRFRQWILDAKLDLTIEEIEGCYRLVVGPSLGLRVPAEALPMNSHRLEWQILRSLLSANQFSAKEVSEILQTSLSTTQRLLRWASDANLLEKKGRGSNTFYRVI